MNLYRTIRPLIFRLDAERAHGLTIAALKLVPKRIDSLTRMQWEGLKQGLALNREDRTPSVGAFLKTFAPQSRLKKYAVPGAIAGLLVTVGAVAVGARYYRVAVEDSIQGVDSAKDAGMKVLAVTNSFTAEELHRADRIVSSLEGVTLESVAELLGNG